METSEIDRPRPHGYLLRLGRLCAAVDGRGNVFTSADPRGGRAAWTIAQRGSRAFVRRRLVRLAPSVRRGRASSARSPARPIRPAAPAAWRIAQVDNENTDTEPTAVSCASASLCVAGGRSGKVLSATEPTGDAAAWKISFLDGPDRGLRRDQRFLPIRGALRGGGQGLQRSCSRHDGVRRHFRPPDARPLRVEADQGEGSHGQWRLVCPGVALRRRGWPQDHHVGQARRRSPGLETLQDDGRSTISPHRRLMPVGQAVRRGR